MITTVVCSIATRPMICKMVRPIENRRSLEKRGLFSQMCCIFCILMLFIAFSLFFWSRNVHVDNLQRYSNRNKDGMASVNFKQQWKKTLTPEHFLSILVRKRYRKRYRSLFRHC